MHIKKLTKRAFSIKEFMIGLLFIGLIAILVFKLFVDYEYKNYTNARLVAYKFADSVMIYKDRYSKENSVYYLYELIDVDYSGNIIDPIGRKEKCDIYNSYVILKPEGKHIHLACGKYLIEGIQGGSTKIFEVSDWSEIQVSNGESRTLYNYKTTGDLKIEKFVVLEEFIARVNKLEGQDYSNLEQIKSNKRYQISTKDLTRSKILLKEFN